MEKMDLLCGFRVGFELCEIGSETRWDKNHHGRFQLGVKTPESFSRMPLLQTLRCTLPACGERADRAVISFAASNQS